MKSPRLYGTRLKASLTPGGSVDRAKAALRPYLDFHGKRQRTEGGSWYFDDKGFLATLNGPSCDLSTRGERDEVATFVRKYVMGEQSGFRKGNRYLGDKTREKLKEALQAYVARSPDTLNASFTRLSERLEQELQPQTRCDAGALEVIDEILQAIADEGLRSELVDRAFDAADVEPLSPEVREALWRLGGAFKIATDPFVGRLTFVRVYSGVLKAGSAVYNSRSGNKERIGRLVRLHANARQEIEEIQAGDIGAVIGLKDTRTGDTLCDEDKPVKLESITFAEPVISMAVEPKTKADQEKMGIALQKLSEEDPTFRVFTNEETAQTIIAGMGELHLDILVDRMRREFKVETTTGKPQVAYRETIGREVDGEHKYIKQTGGRGQYGHVVFKLFPQEPGKGYEFVNSVVGGRIPREFISPCDKGFQEGMSRGILAGFPVVDVKVELLDGSYHDVDSSEMAYKFAASIGFQEAARKADPVILEPIMKVEVTTPESFMGDVMGDLNSRRGTILGTTDRGMAKVIQAQVPLAQMFGYATELRSMTQGRASYAMEPSHYFKVPKNVADEIIASRAGVTTSRSNG